MATFFVRVPRTFAGNISRYSTLVRFNSTSRKIPDLSNPVASSPASQAVNKSRGLEDRHSDAADTRSTQSPISPSNKAEIGSETHEGEEQTPVEAQINNDPNKPTEAKRKNVEKAGQKPLGVEDNQEN